MSVCETGRLCVTMSVCETPQQCHLVQPSANVTAGVTVHVAESACGWASVGCCARLSLCSLGAETGSCARVCVRGPATTSENVS